MSSTSVARRGTSGVATAEVSVLIAARGPVGPGERDVGENVRGDRGVDRDRDVRVDDRHGGALGQLFGGELGELLSRQGLVLIFGGVHVRGGSRPGGLETPSVSTG